MTSLSMVTAAPGKYIHWGVIQISVANAAIIGVMILVFMGLGAVIGLKDRSTAISGAMVTGMRFQPIGLIIITTQLHGNPAYLAPALVFALIDTFLMFGIGIELGRRAPQPQPSTSGAH